MAGPKPLAALYPGPDVVLVIRLEVPQNPLSLPGGLRGRESWVRLVLFSLVLIAAVPVVAGDACVPLCAVTSHQVAGFQPALVVVTSASTVTWTELDTYHIAASRDFCFIVDVPRGGSGAATFSVRDGALFAQEGDVSKACTGATMLPDGSALLEYFCPVHPNMPEAQLLVK